jgi:hypothetical protein
VNFFGFSRLKVLRRAIFFKVRSIAGYPIAGVRTLPISVSVRKVRPVWDFRREFLQIFAAEGPAPGDFF